MVDRVEPYHDGTPATLEMGDRVGSSRDDTPSTLDDMGPHLIEESQSQNERVSFGDSPVVHDEAENNSPTSASDMVDFGTDSNMPPILNLDTARLRRSPRINKKQYLGSLGAEFRVCATSIDRSNNHHVHGIDLCIFKSWGPDRDLQVTDSEMRRPIALPGNRGTTILECVTERPVALPEDKGTTILGLRVNYGYCISATDAYVGFGQALDMPPCLNSQQVMFATNFCKRAGSYDVLFSDPVLATIYYVNISDRFWQGKLGTYDSVALGSISRAYVGTMLFGICMTQKRNLQFQLHLFCENFKVHFNFSSGISKWMRFLSRLWNFKYLVARLSNSNSISNLGISFRGSTGEQLPEAISMIYYPFSFRGSVRKQEFVNVFGFFGF